ncbi:Uncharacterized protein Adt_20710 [Abeliophyllum distichum]|uniref:Uncharacterized protein n=1 Tax=Abeliophyllum distichum TaxID=126358 RepID=A0ABD1SX95_9LAMI
MTGTRSKTHEEHLRKMDKKMGDLNAVYKAVSSKVESSDLTLKVLCNRQEKLENLMSDMNHKYETLVAMMAQLNGSRSEAKDKQADSSIPPSTFGSVLGYSRVGSTQPHQTREDNSVNVKLPKIDFPYFNGDGPRDWLIKANKYFQLHQVAEEFKRFSENTGEEIVETFSKIRQFGSIVEYPKRFEEQESEEVMEISINALDDKMRHKTIRVPGLIKWKKISILIDSGSTHSFVDEGLISQLKYNTNQSKSLTVTVANGEKLQSNAICRPLVWRMRGLEYQFKMRTLKLGGSDMVLGVDWLNQFGPVPFDFDEGHISFMSNKKRVTLCSGSFDGKFELISGPQLDSSLIQQPYGLVG